VHREHTVGVTLQGSSQSTRNWLGLHQLLLTLNKKSPHGQCVCVWEGGENRCNNSVTASPHGQCVCVTRRWEPLQQLSYSITSWTVCVCDKAVRTDATTQLQHSISQQMYHFASQNFLHKLAI